MCLALKGESGKIYHQVETWFEQSRSQRLGRIEYSYQKTWRRDTIDLKPSGVCGASEPITTVASPKSVGGINHRGHGQAAATVME